MAENNTDTEVISRSEQTGNVDERLPSKGARIISRRGFMKLLAGTAIGSALFGLGQLAVQKSSERALTPETNFDSINSLIAKIETSYKTQNEVFHNVELLLGLLESGTALPGDYKVEVHCVLSTPQDAEMPYQLDYHIGMDSIHDPWITGSHIAGSDFNSFSSISELIGFLKHPSIPHETFSEADFFLTILYPTQQVPGGFYQERRTTSVQTVARAKATAFRLDSSDDKEQLFLQDHSKRTNIQQLTGTIVTWNDSSGTETSRKEYALTGVDQGQEVGISLIDKDEYDLRVREVKNGQYLTHFH